MLEFLKKIFIAEFDGNGMNRKTFFAYEFVLFIAISILISLIFGVQNILTAVEISFFPVCGNYCSDVEVFYGKILEIVNNVFFIISLFLLLRFNGGIIERFSFFRFTGFFDVFFQLILTIFKLSIIGLILFFIVNFVLFFSGKNFFLIYEIFNFSEKIISSFIIIIFLLEFIFFIGGLFIGRKKYNLKK